MRAMWPIESSPSTARAYLPAVLVAFLGLGCDIPPAASEAGGPVIVGVDPGEGAVTVRNPTFRVAFDRPLAPTWPVGSVIVVSGPRRFSLDLRADPVTRTLEIAPRNLPPDAAFRLELRGLVDLDGRAMADDVVVHFRTTDALAEAARPIGWDEAQPVLSACATCHGPERRVLDLDLSSAEGVAATAIGVPARQVSASATAGLFGLARIVPRSPSRSYLVWKLSGDPHVPGSALPEHDAISLDDARVLVGWISAGAPLEP